jgi:hypothetical protein
MKNRSNSISFLSTLFLFTFVFVACSKSSTNTPTVNPCNGVAILVTGAVVNADAGVANGSIGVSASGSSDFTFSINNGTAQTSATFNNLAAGKYSITAKNTNGCTGSANFTIGTKDPCTGTPGPGFTAVRTIVTANCAVTGCHNGTQAPDYRTDCTIVDYADLIKQRAVDQANTATQMPQPPRTALAQSDRDKITAWINAGKHITD